MTKIEQSRSGVILRIERTVVRVDKSPLNKRIKIVELDCGHDYYLHPPSLAPRIGLPVACEKCKSRANGNDAG